MDKHTFVDVLRTCWTVSQAAELLNITNHSAQYYMKRFDLKEWFEEVRNKRVLNSIEICPDSMRQAAEAADLPYRTFIEHAKKLGVYQPNPGGKGVDRKRGQDPIPLEDILSGETPYRAPPARLKQRILKAGIMKDICGDCRIGPEWNGKPLTLQLDHINGDHNDNRLENLQILCPNCHTQTPTHGRQKDQYKFRKVTEITVEEIERESDNAQTVTELAEKLNLNPRSQNVRDVLRDFV